MKFVKNEDAVSPVIGVILMVAITVILAAVIAAFVFNLGGSQEKAPTASIVAANNPDTSNPDIKISHKGGDLLKAGDWKISLVTVGSAPAYNTSQSTGDFAVGGLIIVQSITGTNSTNASAAFSASNTLLNGSTPLAVNQKYDVKLVHVPSNAMLIDTVIEVR